MTAPPCPTGALRGEAGVTLVEALIAMVVLTVGILGLFVLHNTALHSNATAYRFNVATLLAEDAMEYLLSLDFNPESQDAVIVPDGSVDDTSPADPLKPFSRSLPGESGILLNAMGSTDGDFGTPIYTRSYVTEYVDATDASRIALKVRVTFENPANGARQGVTVAQTRTLDTYSNN
ncbi:prepilin-type N-terminal cleavage/methylation domain-containing protein [Myxococcota bacterium]|nr:prepilin-type N-terminal cleavage/methylation domain-containing protein [Myxococcota bacterium]